MGKKKLSQKDSNSNSFEEAPIKTNINNIIVYKLGDNKYSLRPRQIISFSPITHNFPFKNKNWVRDKDRATRNTKNIKNLGKDIIDSLFYKAYQDLEAGPSVFPKKKFCDFTGFETNYSEINTGIRYYNSKVLKIFQGMTQPNKDQYLSIRKALIKLK